MKDTIQLCPDCDSELEYLEDSEDSPYFYCEKCEECFDKAYILADPDGEYENWYERNS